MAEMWAVEPFLSCRVLSAACEGRRCCLIRPSVSPVPELKTHSGYWWTALVNIYYFSF